MANHVRHQIRDTIAAALTGMVTAATVYTGRLVPLEEKDLPAVLVITEEETISIGSKASILARELSVTLEGHAVATNGLVDVLDTIANEVEAAMAAAGDLGGLAKAVGLDSVEVEMTGEGTIQGGFIRLAYTVNYETSSAAPDVAL